VKKGAIDEAARDADARARLHPHRRSTPVAGASLVVEAATENRDLKFKIFADLDRLAGDGSDLASNTSSIAITEIAARTRRPSR
jgi:3-hydroxybutyryl-CoA dehydrogenase